MPFVDSAKADIPQVRETPNFKSNFQVLNVWRRGSGDLHDNSFMTISLEIPGQPEFGFSHHLAKFYDFVVLEKKYLASLENVDFQRR